jgi:hypothetical protein
MARFRLLAAILIATVIPAATRAAEPRVADVRVGKHGDFERIVVELDASEPVEVHWRLGDGGSDVFAIEARPLLSRQVLSSGRPLVGDMLLVAAESGSELHLAAASRRTRAFLLDDPRRLVIDVAPAGDAPFDAPSDVRAIVRGAAADSEPEQAEAPLPEIAEQPPASPGMAEPASTQAEEPAGSATEPATTPEPALARETAAEADAPAALPTNDTPDETGLNHAASELSQKSWLLSRALLVPLLAGVGVLLLAVGGLALASTRRARGPRRDPQTRLLESADPGGLSTLSADRLDLLEKRVEDEVRARTQLEGQLAQVVSELANLRDVLTRARSQAAARAAAPSAPQ